ncbi:unnamed protein product [Rhizoctonia solani]|uniref:Protein kinase domain-containing protein n=1 Tax=Rhizoctonia solani TaxID=456999 RepID=A0A8H3I0J2_9AGAM|nr:unnamed protein product [Rhizoctonia solani]
MAFVSGQQMALPYADIDGPIQPQPAVISRTMLPNQIASLLVLHGVKDITNELNFQRQSAEPFARGGFGSIYQGELRDGRSVAIKYIRSRDCEELELRGGRCKYAAHELYTWSKCDHPGVLKALGFALVEEFIVLVSPWMQNGPLADHLMRESLGDRLRFCIDLAETVEYLHRKGIVHGDIKAVSVDRYPSLCFKANGP